MNEDHYIEKKLYSKKTIYEIEKKINLLGVSTKLTVYRFLNLRLVGSVVIFCLVLYFSKFGYLLAPVFCISYYVVITYI